MARENNKLPDLFKQHAKSEQEDVSVIRIHDNDTKKESNEIVTISDATQSLIDKDREKSKQKTIEQTHTRRSFLIENTLLDEFDKLSKQRHRGFKTLAINHMLRLLVDDMKSGRR